MADALSLHRLTRVLVSYLPMEAILIRLTIDVPDLQHAHSLFCHWERLLMKGCDISYALSI